MASVTQGAEHMTRDSALHPSPVTQNPETPNPKPETLLSPEYRRRFSVLKIAPTFFFADYGCHVRILEEIRVLQGMRHRAVLCTYPSGDNLPRPGYPPRHGRTLESQRQGRPRPTQVLPGYAPRLEGHTGGRANASRHRPHPPPIWRSDGLSGQPRGTGTHGL